MQRYLGLLGIWLIVAAHPGGAVALDEVRRTLLQETCGELADEVRLSEKDAATSLWVCPLGGDATGEATEALRDALTGRGIGRPIEPGILDRARTLAGIPPEPSSSPREALRRAAAAEAGLVVVGQLDRLYRSGPRAVIDIKFQIYRVEDARALHIGSRRKGIEQTLFSLPFLRERIHDVTVWYMVLAWVLIVALLPFLTFLVREWVAGEGRMPSVTLIVTYTLADAFWTLCLLGFSLYDLLSSTLFVLSVVAALLYNLAVCTRVAQITRKGAS